VARIIEEHAREIEILSHIFIVAILFPKFPAARTQTDVCSNEPFKAYVCINSDCDEKCFDSARPCVFYRSGP
jgi:hypothetical protein